MVPRKLFRPIVGRNSFFASTNILMNKGGLYERRSFKKTKGIANYL